MAKYTNEDLLANAEILAGLKSDERTAFIKNFIKEFGIEAVGEAILLHENHIKLQDKGIKQFIKHVQENKIEIKVKGKFIDIKTEIKHKIEIKDEKLRQQALEIGD